jgi:WD40 repeat protein
MNIDSSGEQLVSGGLKWIKVWDLRTGKMTAQLNNDTGARRLLGLSFRSQDTTIVSVFDNTLTLWDVPTGRQKHFEWTYRTDGDRYRGAPWGVAINGDGTRIALAYKGWPLEVWDIEDRELKQRMPLRNPIASCFNPANDDVFGMDEDGCLMKVDSVTDETQEIDGKAHIVSCTNKGIIATGNRDGCLKLRRAENLKLLYRLDKYDGLINGLIFSPDGQRLYDIRCSECNIWMPEVLIRLTEDDEGDIDDATISEVEPRYSAFGNDIYLMNIFALTSSPDGSYVYCGKGNGTVCLYETQSGRFVQVLYAHASRIQDVICSKNGFVVASADIFGRIIAGELFLQPSGEWKFVTKLDINVNTDDDHGIRQLLLSDGGSRLLVSTQFSDRMYKISDGSEIGTKNIRSNREVPKWLLHPLDPSKILLLASNYFKIYEWETFHPLIPSGGGRINRLTRPTGEWQSSDTLIEIEAFSSQDGRHIVSMMTVIDGGVNFKRCSFWETTHFTLSCKEVVEECGDFYNVHISDLVGVLHNKAVFIDRDLWVCTQGAEDEDFEQHFYIPLDWINTNEERPTIVTPKGEFVYAKHGELIVVKKGLSAKQAKVSTFLIKPGQNSTTPTQND